MSKSKSKKPVSPKTGSDCEYKRNENRALANLRALRNMKAGKATKKDAPFVQAWLEGTAKHLAKFIPDPDTKKK